MVVNTSLAALCAVAPKINMAHENILQVLRTNPDQTADNIAEWLNASKLFIRPRVSELSKAGKIVRNPYLRGKNSSGMSAAVWRIAA